jgi:hypothetical protein
MPIPPTACELLSVNSLVITGSISRNNEQPFLEFLMFFDLRLTAFLGHHNLPSLEPCIRVRHVSGTEFGKLADELAPVTVLPLLQKSKYRHWQFG